MEDKYHEAEEERINVQVAMEIELEKKQTNLEQAHKELEKIQKDIVKVDCFCKKQSVTYESHHEKTCSWHMQTTKAEISLRIRAAWSSPLLFAS